jgi:LacI family transcriptional regulator/LacI family sucrose operon transcriptional repressor
MEVRVNIKDVAKMAGVSISTISRVINNSAFVSPDVKQRVEKILEETGYRPNALAKELQKNKTNTIGVILPRIDLGTFAVIFDGISAVLNANGYNILLANTRDRFEEELRYLDLMHEKRVDGILYFATGMCEEHKRAISKLRMPVVIVGQPGDAVNCPAIFLDSFGASRAMVQYLVSLGHRRIGCLAVPDHDYNVGTQRREGYLAALADNGIDADPSLIVTGDFEFESGARGAQLLMEGNAAKGSGAPNGRPSAIFCITDRLAVAASGQLIRSGWKIPDDVSVACVDDPLLLRYCAPSVTTMSFDYTDMGIRAGNMIIDCIEKISSLRGGQEAGTRTVQQNGPPQIALPFTMKIRESTGCTVARSGGKQ